MHQPDSWPPSEPTTPAPPADPRVTAALAVVWRYGLFPVGVLVIAGFLVYRLDHDYMTEQREHTKQLQALGAKIDQHQASMDRAEAVRQANYNAQIQRLRGICYGVTEEGSRARAFCEAD